MKGSIETNILKSTKKNLSYSLLGNLTVCRYISQHTCRYLLPTVQQNTCNCASVEVIRLNKILLNHYLSHLFLGKLYRVCKFADPAVSA